MKLSLIICTYMRPESLYNLLKTVEQQTKKPDEVLIVDGSTNNLTKEMVNKEQFDVNLKYFKVSDDLRGLTKQRNYGVEKISKEMEVVAFLDDDIELESNYFEELNNTYKINKDAIAVGGVTTNETKWKKAEKEDEDNLGQFVIDGWSRRSDIRYRVREKLGLVSNMQPGKVVPYGHERSIGFLPPNGKVYETDFLMGGISSYKNIVFETLSFSHFFDGYGLYEDKDFSLRVRKYGKIYINTNARVEHHHDPLGRPNYVRYGTMVVWNGWRVWRVATPDPEVKDKIKWWVITILLTYIRFTNVIVGPKRKVALEDFVGRHVGMVKLLFSRPDMSDL